MKAQCKKVSPHNRLVACGFAALTAVSAYHVGNLYGWNGDRPGTIDNVAIGFAVVGFAVALLCVLSVPLNRVAWARLVVGGLLATYAYLSLPDSKGWVLAYGVGAVAAVWHLIEEGLERELPWL